MYTHTHTQRHMPRSTSFCYSCYLIWLTFVWLAVLWTFGLNVHFSMKETICLFLDASHMSFSYSHFSIEFIDCFTSNVVDLWLIFFSVLALRQIHSGDAEKTTHTCTSLHLSSLQLQVGCVMADTLALRCNISMQLSETLMLTHKNRRKGFFFFALPHMQTHFAVHCDWFRTDEPR